MTIVEEVDVLAELRPEVLEQLRHVQQIRLRRPGVFRWQASLRRLVRCVPLRDAVGARDAGHAALRANRKELVLDVFRDRV